MMHWPLIIPALALYFYIAAASRSARQALWSGGITGTLFGLWITYQAFGHLTTLPGAEAFSSIARHSQIPLALLLGGGVFGAIALLYRALRSRNILLNALAGASLFMLGEMLEQFILQGYYWGSVAHSFVNFAPALTVASLGGTFLVSFCIALVACLVAELLLAPRAAAPAAALGAAATVVLWAIAAALAGMPHQTGSITIASVQMSDATNVFAPGSYFIQGQARALLAEAGASGADLVIYPQSIIEGSVYDGPPYTGLVHGSPVTEPLAAQGPWLSGLVASSSVALVWPQVYDSTHGRFYETFEFYKDGAHLAEYQKQYLYPFTDYYPAWMRTLGLVTINDDITPGPQVSSTQVGPWRVGAIDCSELQLPALARREARESDFLLSMGSDTFFNNEMPPQYSLASARYRAAENRISVLRVALTGPSALIGQGGAVIALLPTGVSGVLRGTLPLYEHRQTLYNRFGSWPVFCAALGILAAALYIRFRQAQPHSQQ